VRGRWRTTNGASRCCGSIGQTFHNTATLRNSTGANLSQLISSADDPRWLWPHFARLICLLRPRYALLENVPGLLSAGFGDVLGDLAALRYDAEWECVPALAVGAPHLRWRVFIVAYADSERLERTEPVEQRQCFNSQRGYDGDKMADTRSIGREGSLPLCGWQSVFVDGSSSQRQEDIWAVEPDVGRVANGVPSRVDRLRGLGNAVVPQVAEWVGRQILASQSCNAELS
jgi:DNA (cytosine-5)-methyltransferase 1